MFANESAPLIYEFFQLNYIPYTFKDEYQNASLSDINFYPQLNFLENLTRNDPTSHWFNNVTSGVSETAYAIMLQAFSDALLTLQNDFGSDASSWTYGAWHKGSFPSLTGLDALSPKVLPINGSQYTLNPSESQVTSDPTAIADMGASERALYDLSNLSNSVAALPGGQSGNPVSPHYHDLLDKYFLPWKYYPQYFFNDVLPKKYVESTLILRSSK